MLNQYIRGIYKLNRHGVTVYNIETEEQDESKRQNEMVNGENNPLPPSPVISTSHRESYSSHFPRDRVNEQNDFFTWRIVNLIEGILLLAAISSLETEIFVHRETGNEHSLRSLW